MVEVGMICCLMKYISLMSVALINSYAALIIIIFVNMSLVSQMLLEFKFLCLLTQIMVRTSGL